MHRRKIIAVAALTIVGASIGIAHSQGAFSPEVGLSGAEGRKDSNAFLKRIHELARELDRSRASFRLAQERFFRDLGGF